MSVKPRISPSARGTISAMSSRSRARSTLGTGTPGPETRRPMSTAVPQSAKRDAYEPIDQSRVLAASIGGEGGLAPFGLLPRCDHGGSTSLTLGDAAVGPLLQELCELLVEHRLVERDLDALGRSDRRC